MFDLTYSFQCNILFQMFLSIYFKYSLGNIIIII